MVASLSDRIREPMQRVQHRARETVYRRPVSTLGTIAIAAAVIAVGVWIWPELRRTVKIHRM